MFSEEERRSLFPVTRSWIYLNHASVGPLPTPVVEAAECYLHRISNGGEAHWKQTGPLMDDLRGSLARRLRVRSDEIAFTRNTSEGLSLLAYGLDWREGDNLVLPSIEFPANVHPWIGLKHRGVETRFVEPRNGRIDVEVLSAAVDARTRVISISSVQFFNGFVADLSEIGAFCRSRGILFCVDVTQHLGALPLDLSGIPVDFAACGSHKWLMAGEGLGFIFCRSGLAERLRPSNVGWQGVVNWMDFFDRSCEPKPGALRLETGNCSAFGLYTLNASLAFFDRFGEVAIAERVGANATLALEEALRRGFRIVTPDTSKRSGIVSFIMPGYDSAVLVETLAGRGVQVVARQGVMRISPHFYNTADEIHAFFGHLDDLCKTTPSGSSGANASKVLW
ncbi:MAG: aminotransferase class V-fold PLP-dependent enzyme [Candidatus Riflebacteria bacterium]|nr:aminotransferase class V-fold PLP-dependent enzyme [Candidatus Riflebacteria bacterium]